MKENALYKIICKECRKKEIRSEYWGETGRNCFLRGGEHIEGLKNKEEDNALWKHTWDVHDGEGNSDTFEMKLEKTFKKPLERQIREGVELEMCTADIVMNSKAEWNGSRIPRIIIEEREKQTEDRNSGMSKTTGENRKRSLKLIEAQKRSLETETL